MPTGLNGQIIEYFPKAVTFSSLSIANVLVSAVHVCTKIRTIQRRLAWFLAFLRKDDTQKSWSVPHLFFFAVPEAV